MKQESSKSEEIASRNKVAIVTPKQYQVILNCFKINLEKIANFDGFCLHFNFLWPDFLLSCIFFDRSQVWLRML